MIRKKQCRGIVHLNNSTAYTLPVMFYKRITGTTKIMMYRLYLSNIRDVHIVVLTHKKTKKKIKFYTFKNISVRGMHFFIFCGGTK